MSIIIVFAPAAILGALLERPKRRKGPRDYNRPDNKRKVHYL